MKRLILGFAVVVALAVAIAPMASAGPRSGTLHASKECSQYTGAAGSFCTITSSSLNAIKPGSKVVYASPILETTVIFNSDLVLDGPSNNNAFGHVSINVLLPPGPEIIGYITFSGGTGEFQHFHAGPLAVRCSTLIDCTWDGPYSFSPK